MASIVLKKVGRNTYAYLAFRRGGKVIHEYIGPASKPEVAKTVRTFEEKRRVPERFAYLFWDSPISRIDLKKNAPYVIERILESGDFAAFAWVESVFPGERIVEIALSSRKISGKARNFWRVWYGLGAVS